MSDHILELGAKEEKKLSLDEKLKWISETMTNLFAQEYSEYFYFAGFWTYKPSVFICDQDNSRIYAEIPEGRLVCDRSKFNNSNVEEFKITIGIDTDKNKNFFQMTLKNNDSVFNTSDLSQSMADLLIRISINNFLMKMMFDNLIWFSIERRKEKNKKSSWF